MPMYYFDSYDGDRRIVDDVGLEYSDMRQAREEAIASLPDLARDVLPDGDYRVMSVTVRNEHGIEVFTASLTLVGYWLVDPSSA